MSGRIRSHVRSNVYGLLALFLVLTGGTAYALDGSNTVFSDDIVNGEVKSADIAEGGVNTGDLALNSVRTARVLDNSLTGADIDESTLAGVDDTCPNLMTRIGGVICIDDDSRGQQTWGEAVNTCANAELRLPTPSEAYLAYSRGVISSHYPWTDAVSDQDDAGGAGDNIVDEAVIMFTPNGQMYGFQVNNSQTASTFCVVAPSDLY